jgi:hypothetical protein
VYFNLQSIIPLLVVPDLTDNMVAVPRVEPVDKYRKLLDILARLLERR